MLAVDLGIQSSTGVKTELIGLLYLQGSLLWGLHLERHMGSVHQMKFKKF